MQYRDVVATDHW